MKIPNDTLTQFYLLVIFLKTLVYSNMRSSRNKNQTKCFSSVIVLLMATIGLPRIVWIAGFIFSMGMFPWLVVMGVPAGKQTLDTGGVMGCKKYR